MRILLVDDNYDAAANMGDYLEILGHEVDYAYHGKTALQLLSDCRFDLIVLDVMMPVMNGLDTCEAIRQSEFADIPIIFVTARDTLSDKLAGFKVGGDDYLVKPFELAELNARIEALVLRTNRKRVSKLEFAELTFDTLTNQLTFQGQLIQLDPTQKRIVKLLLSRAPALVDSKDIAYEIWSDDLVDSSALRTQIYRLRKALPDGVLRTERGKGYRIDDAR